MLAVVSCHFNPAGYARPVLNCRDYLAAMPTPVFLAELYFDRPSFPGAFLSLKGGPEHVLWQKERLLNLVMDRLPPEFDRVAWLDADVLGPPDWIERIDAALDDSPVVQCFSHDGEREAAAKGGNAPGRAWACRRELLDGLGLYDRCVVGSGDCVFAYGVSGVFGGDYLDRRTKTREYVRDMLGYMARLYSRTKGRVGWVDADISHLWHGERADRQYNYRHAILRRHSFRPSDVEVDGNGLLAWTGSKPDLERDVANFFSNRNEDGEQPRPIKVRGPRLREKKDGVIRVGAYYPQLWTGGAEVWLRTLLTHLPEGFVASGIAVEQHGEDTLDTGPLVATTDVAAVAEHSDVMIVWGVRDPSRLDGFDGPTVYVAQNGVGWEAMGERLAPRCSHTAAVSRYCLTSIPEAFKASTKVIHNGVERMPLPDRDDARRRLGIGDRIAVGYVGRWADNKDVLAAARAVASMPDAVCVMHGYNSYTAHDYAAEAEELTGGRVIVRTPADSLQDTYAALDCFVHAPTAEGFGLTYVEAWQAGVPVVASNVGVIAESGRADVATIVEAGSPGPVIAEAVREAVKGGTVDAALRLAADRYSAEAMGRAWGDWLGDIYNVWPT